MRFEKILLELGLTKNKGIVYLSLLQLNKASAQDVARKINLPRTTTFEILEKLVELDIIKKEKIGKKIFFSAYNPKKLFNIIERRKNILTPFIPELTAYYDASKKTPRVKLFEGKDGVKAVWEDILKVPNKILYEIDSVYDIYNTEENDYMNDFVQRRTAANIYCYSIHSINKDKIGVADIWPTKKSELREARYFKFDYDLPLSILIYDNKVGIVDAKNESYGLIIQSIDFYQAIKNIYLSVWEISKLKI